MKRKLGVRLAAAAMIAMVTASTGGCASEAIKDALLDLYEKEDKKGLEKDEQEKVTQAEEETEAAEETKTAEETEAEEGLSGEQGADIESDQAAPSSSSRSGSYSDFIREQLFPQLGTASNESFSYGFEKVQYAGDDYWFACPKTAGLSDGIISTFQRDLDKDGLDELIVLYIEGSKGKGQGKNTIWAKIYGEDGGYVTEMGSMCFQDCFSGNNGEEYLFALKDTGNKKLFYTARTGNVYTWADGISPEIHLYEYTRNSFNEIFQIDTIGSDGSWWDEWKRQLRTFGFDIVANDWDQCNLAGESGFEVLAYGKCDTIENRQNGSREDYQTELLENGQVEGGIFGPDSSIVQQMNQTMTAYGTYSNNYSYSGNSYDSGSYSSSSADYILPQSSSTYLTRQDLAGLTPEQLRLARNEIYARHGRKFQDQGLQNYFNSKSWYIGTIEPNQFKDEYLNGYEKENLKLIQSLEK